MILTGLVSGVLLDGYCPDEDDAADCYKLWIVIALATVLIPIVLYFLRSLLEQPLFEAKIYVDCLHKEDVEKTQDSESLLAKDNYN